MSSTNYKIHPYLLFYCSLAFIICTVVGTISHEFGHIIVAKTLGYETELHYGSMNWNETIRMEELKTLYLKNEAQLLNNQNTENHQGFNQLKRKIQRDNFIIGLGGPLQTWLSSIFGLFLLIYWKRSEPIRLTTWLGIFLTLFSLRFIFNLLQGAIIALLSRDGNYFGGDELKIDNYLHLKEGSTGIVFAAVATIICFWLIFKFLPKHLRLTFILSGLVGSALGYYLWFILFGPLLLP